MNILTFVVELAIEGFALVSSNSSKKKKKKKMGDSVGSRQRGSRSSLATYGMTSNESGQQVLLFLG
jgi:hypothetical protein